MRGVGVAIIITTYVCLRPDLGVTGVDSKMKHHGLC